MGCWDLNKMEEGDDTSCGSDVGMSLAKPTQELSCNFIWRLHEACTMGGPTSHGSCWNLFGNLTADLVPILGAETT